MQPLSALVDADWNVVSPTARDGASSFGASSFGADIRGIKLSTLLEPLSAERLRELLARYQILVFRDQPVDPAAQLSLTQVFGDPEPSILRRPSSHHVPGFRGVLRLRNTPGSPTIDYGQSWHSDGLAYARIPHGVTVLSCKACPEGAGDTLFASQVRAYAAMPEALQAEIATLRWLLPPMPFSEVRPGKALTQPVVRRHDVTGDKFLFCAPNARSIVGLSEPESRRVLSQLLGYQISPRCQYRHRWRPNDLVLWDNCALLHNRADAVPYSESGLRELHRTATAGRYAAVEMDE